MCGLEIRKASRPPPHHRNKNRSCTIGEEEERRYAVQHDTPTVSCTTRQEWYCNQCITTSNPARTDPPSSLLSLLLPITHAPLQILHASPHTTYEVCAFWLQSISYPSTKHKSADLQLPPCKEERRAKADSSEDHHLGCEPRLVGNVGGNGAGDQHDELAFVTPPSSKHTAPESSIVEFPTSSILFEVTNSRWRRRQHYTTLTG